MLHDFVNGSNQHWVDFYQYDNTSGRLVLHAHPSAILPNAGTYYDDTFVETNPGHAADLLKLVNGNYVYLNDSAGLIETTTYYTNTTATEPLPPDPPTAGGVAGYVQDTFLRRGELGGASAVQQSHTDYWLHQASLLNGGARVYPVADSWVYANAGGSGGRQISYSYSWRSDGAGVTTQAQSMQTTLPLVGAAQNGPGTAATATTVYDQYGRAIWTQDADGFIGYTAYDQATGAVTKTIQDVKIDAQHAPDYDNQTPPTGWTTPANGGLHLITRMAVDTLGRTTKLTDPKSNVTYTVYRDAAHAVRTYPGWVAPLTSAPYTTGPTQVSQEVWPAAGSSNPLFEETLTTSTPPAIDSMTRQPTGGEAIQVGDIQSWSRQYTNSAGQAVRTDTYGNKTGIAAFSSAPYLPTNNPGTSTNYYTSSTDYDSRGRASRQQSPAHTVTVTSYDGLGRVTSHSVGTTDANQVVTDQNQYDGGGVGDGTLTQVTQYVIAGDLNTARLTQNFYDWRDRLVASKSGAGAVLANEDTTTHRPLVYRLLDNLGEVLTESRYDADQITIPGSTNGVPNPPVSSRLRAQRTTAYDDQGRPYQEAVYGVSTSGLIITPPLNRNLWYDLRGHLIKDSEPGGQVTKTRYDGAGRPYVSYVTNEVASPSWAEANSVSGNLVLTQTETSYDADGNPTLVTTRERFHTATATGALQGPSGAGPNARVSYAATYYDPANRTTATADFGTNAGQGAPTIGASPPAPSDAVLVTKTSYLADTVQTVTLTGGPSGGTFKLLLNMQATGPIAYNAGAAAVQSALAGLVGLRNVLVTGPAGAPGIAGGPWTVRFTGTLAGTSVALLTADPSLLTGGTNPNVAISLLSQAGDAGRAQQMTDPRGLVQKTDYDLLGRSVRTVQAFSNAATPPANANTTTEFTYDGDNHQLTVQADLANGTFQRTHYTYGITTPFASADVLASVQYPDKNTGLPSTQAADQESYGYNVQGEMTGKTDRNGTAHAYTLDALGRQTVDAVTIPMNSPVDTAVQRLETAYDTYGNASQFTSYSATSGGTMVNQVQRTFNAFGQLTAESQNHGGSIPVYTVQYGYSALTAGNYSRPVSMTYPNGRVLTYAYGATGSLDDQVSRLTAISDTSGTLESFTDNNGVSAYLGLGTVVQRSHPEAALNLTYYQAGGSADAGDPYVGLDRFGRVVNQLWVQNGSPTDSFQYGYDRDGNRVYRDNLLKPTFGEIYHAAGVVNTYDGQGNLLTRGYDPLSEITQFNRGTLTPDKTNLVGAASQNQAWGYDALGNWASFTNGVSTDNRSHNQQNQITAMAGLPPQYDNNGNTTRYTNAADGVTRNLVYDAWNRLVQVTNGADTLATYSYDALGRRIQEAEANAFGDAVTRDLYFSAQWQVIEERESRAGVYTNRVRAQYVWSPVYVDALVERDRDPARNGSGSLSERFYVQQDANFNVTALETSAGLVAERYVYDPFGNAAVYDLNWNNPSTSSQYGWAYLHQGGRFDSGSALYSFRNRDFSPTLGRWIQADPLRYVNGPNLYEGLGNDPEAHLDPNGTDFIALADRAVTGTSPLFYHYSLEYWARVYDTKGRGIPSPQKEMYIADYQKKNPNVAKRGGVELLPVGGYGAFYRTTQRILGLEIINISVIRYDDTGTKPTMGPIRTSKRNGTRCSKSQRIMLARSSRTIKASSTGPSPIGPIPTIS